MRYLYVPLTVLLLGVLFTSCGGEGDFQELGEVATITREDFRLCACCGGWYIDISDETYRFTKWPQDLDIPSGADFPMHVRVEWKPLENPCIGDEIDVTTIDILPF